MSRRRRRVDQDRDEPKIDVVRSEEEILFEINHLSERKRELMNEALRGGVVMISDPSEEVRALAAKIRRLYSELRLRRAKDAAKEPPPDTPGVQSTLRGDVAVSRFKFSKTSMVVSTSEGKSPDGKKSKV